jgi:putative inorganic carbon (hco3(-)) transporter
MESATATLGSKPFERETPGALRLLVDPAFWLSAMIAATMFSGNWGNLGSPLPLDRVCFLLTFATLALRMPLGMRFRLRLEPVHWAMLLALIYVIGSAVISGSIATHDGSFALLDRFGLVPFICFTIAPVVFRSARERSILLIVLTVTGAYLGLTALAEVLRVNALTFPKYILDPNVGIHEGRARGPFVEAGANGMAMWVCVVAAMLLTTRVSSLRWRFACAAVVVLCCGGILFTLTRGIWLGAAAGAAVTLAFYRPLRKYLFAVALLGGAVVVTALAVIPSLNSSVQQRTASDLTLWDRYNLNNAAVNMAGAYPLFGVGWQGFGSHADRFYQLGKTYPLVTSTVVHNLVLSNLAELGLVGLTLWLAALVFGLGGALARRPPPELRMWQFGLMAIVVEWLIAGMFGPLAYAFANSSLWVWAGIVYGPRACPVVPAHTGPETQASEASGAASY